jgi:hypothetical protein
MSNYFLSTSDSRLKSWKNLRQSLDNTLTDIDHLKIITEWWSKAPIEKGVVDWDSPKDWLDPWELMYEGNFDHAAISLGMFYTLLLANDDRWNENRLQLSLAITKDRDWQGIILIVDKKWGLNYIYNTVVDLHSLGETLLVTQKY